MHRTPGTRRTGRDDPPVALAAALKAETARLHRSAERAGLMRELVRGRVERRAYCALLRNLQAIYRAFESQLEQRGDDPVFAELPLATLARAGALAGDLHALHGSAWERELPVCAAARRYADRIDHIATTAPFMLLAHVYVRYLGDLSGGQILVPLIARALDLDPASPGLGFYRFGEAPAALGAQVRAAINRAPLDEAQRRAIVTEARRSFRTHIELFEELAPAVPGAGHQPP
jgi:heme oxygenase